MVQTPRFAPSTIDAVRSFVGDPPTLIDGLFVAKGRIGVRLARTALGLLWLFGFCLPACTQERPAPTPSSAAATAGSEQTNVASLNQSNCPSRPIAGADTAVNIAVTLDPDTLWRPRGGEVHFTVSSRNGGMVAVQAIQVCMGWSPRLGEQPTPDKLHDLRPSPLVRSLSMGGSGAGFGAIVPNLPSVPSPWVLNGGVTYTAAFTVPVADMVVAVTLGDGTKSLVLLPVGVTSVVYAVVVVALCVAGGWALPIAGGVLNRNGRGNAG
jgi:hypothetical protein